MFNGAPASYADIKAGFTFERTIADEISRMLRSPEKLTATVLGAGGVGKTTAARQVALLLQSDGFCAWEHQGDHEIDTAAWLLFAKELQEQSKQGILVVDDAHLHLHEINILLDSLITDGLSALKILAVSSRNNWQLRVKTPNLFKFGKEYYLSKLNTTEIDKLIRACFQSGLKDSAGIRRNFLRLCHDIASRTSSGRT